MKIIQWLLSLIPMTPQERRWVTMPRDPRLADLKRQLASGFISEYEYTQAVINIAREYDGQ